MENCSSPTASQNYLGLPLALFLAAASAAVLASSSSIHCGLVTSTRFWAWKSFFFMRTFHDGPSPILIPLSDTLTALTLSFFVSRVGASAGEGGGGG